MMLIVLSNVLLFSIRWFCDRWRQNRYADIMYRLLNRTSVLIQRCQAVRYPKKHEVAGIFKGSLPLEETQLLTPPSQLLLEDDFLTMHEMKAWATVDLSSWVTYSHNRQPPKAMTLDFQPGQVNVLLEAVLSEQLGLHGNCQAYPVHDLSYHVLTFGTPVAWTSGDLYAVIMSCDDLGSLVRMVDAFGQHRLVISDGLEVTSIGTVHITGSPQALSLSREIFSPAAEKNETFDLDSSESTSQNIDSSNLVNKTDKSDTRGKVVSSAQNKITQKSNSPVIGSSYTTAHSSNKKIPTPKPKSHSKPPNILIYCGVKDTKRKFEEALESIKGCVNTDSYTIYHLKQEQILTMPWQENAAALVISSCQRLQPEVKQKVCEYVFNHQGNLLSFGSSADSLFANHLDIVKHEVNENMTTFDFQDWIDVSSFCGPFVYSNCREYARVVIPALGEKTLKENAAHVVQLNLEKGGTAILSQLFLEQDPVSQAKDKISFDLLKKSNTARLAVLREFLTLSGLDTQHAAPPALTPCYLMAQKQNFKESFLASLRLKDGVLKSKTMSLIFPSKSQSQTEPQATLLPVLTEDNNCDSTSFEYFDMTEYWRYLKTSNLGQIVMYTDVITTTMTVFDGLLFSLPKDVSPVAIAGRQVQGKGRAGNAWLSPVGCAMFTAPLDINLHSVLGQRISFLQHLVALAVVRGVLTLPGYQDLDLRLKWPNDIYYGKEMKLGGVLVLSSIMADTVYATVGCGVNVANSDPTICINDIIQHRNASNPSLPPLSPLTTGQTIARTLNCLEELIKDFESKGHEYVSKLYYRHWLHGGCKVKVDLDTKAEGEIVGVDEYGFLSIKTEDGKLISVQPDGNSFDMMHNLIHVKTK